MAYLTLKNDTQPETLAAVRTHDHGRPSGAMATLQAAGDFPRRAWPSHPGAGLKTIALPGRPALWVRQDVLAFALIALGPQRIEAIIAAIPQAAAADDRIVCLATGARITDRTGIFTRMADQLFPTTGRKPAKSGQAAVRGLRQKLEHDPAYDLSDMDFDALLVTYQRYCRQPQHPITIACLRELARRQSGLAS